MNRNKRINPISVDELEKGTTNYYSSSTASTLRVPAEVVPSRRRGRFTTMDWVQFVVLVLILIALAAILGIIIAVIVKVQQFSNKADNVFGPNSPLGSVLRRLLSSN